jgi:glycosyltransferase involved in cell wall biosynthesis
LKVLVTQLGARRHYLVPAALERAGVLQRFVTDYYSTNLTGMMKRLPVKLAVRAGGRNSADLPSKKVASFPVFAVADKFATMLAGGRGHPSRRWMRSGARFARMSSRYLTDETTHVYAFTSAARELFTAARRSGVTCILDHATAPRKHEMGLVYEEHDRHPEWAAQPDRDPFLEEYEGRQLEEARLAHLVVCNSTFARRVLLGANVGAAKVAVVPLGVRIPEPAALSNNPGNRPGPLRVLFVGAEALRKGVPYLVKALGMLGTRAVQARFVGDLGLSAFGIDQVQRVGEVTGAVPRVDMDSHFHWADVLVLPSISDTFGLVMIEAMARGLPVIASDHTGGPDVIREGLDGFIVPIRDSEAIAAKLDLLKREPRLIADLSRNASEHARKFSHSAYRDRLLQAIGNSSTEKGATSAFGT